MATLTSLIPQDESEAEALALEEGSITRGPRVVPRWGKAAAAAAGVLLLCAGASAASGQSSSAAGNGQKAVDLFDLGKLQDMAKQAAGDKDGDSDDAQKDLSNALQGLLGGGGDEEGKGGTPDLDSLFAGLKGGGGDKEGNGDTPDLGSLLGGVLGGGGGEDGQGKEGLGNLLAGLTGGLGGDDDKLPDFGKVLSSLGNDEQLKRCSELMKKGSEAAAAAAGSEDGGRRLEEEEEEEEEEEGEDLSDEEGAKDCLKALGLDPDNADKAKGAGLDLEGFLKNMAKGSGGDGKDQGKNQVAFGELLGNALQNGKDDKEDDFHKKVGDLLEGHKLKEAQDAGAAFSQGLGAFLGGKKGSD